MTLIAFPAAQETAVVEHIQGCRIQSPVVSFTGITGLARNLDETVVETEIVSDAVLPHRELGLVIREAANNEVADSTESEFLLRRL